MEKIIRRRIHLMDLTQRRTRKKIHYLLNTLIKNIQFNIEYSDCSIPFLDIMVIDIMVIKRQTNIITDILNFYKAT